jgi:hypothetical protein
MEVQLSTELTRELGYLTEEEICAILEVVPATARNWRCRRLGPDFVTAGNVALYPIDNFTRWLKGRVKQTAA